MDAPPAPYYTPTTTSLLNMHKRTGMSKDVRKIMWKYTNAEDCTLVLLAHGCLPTHALELEACSLVAHAMAYGYVNILEWINIAVPSALQYDELFEDAASFGHIPILEWLHYGRAGLNPPFNPAETRAAALDGHFDALKWLHGRGCPLHENTCRIAAARGDLPMLKWANARGGAERMLDRCDEEAANNGHVHILEWLYVVLPSFDDNHVITCAIRSHHLSVLQWLCSKGCSLSVRTFYFAVSFGNMKTIEWMADKITTADEIDFDYVQLASIRNNRIDVFEWLRKRGVRMSAHLCVRANESRAMDIVEWLHANGCECACAR